MNYLFIFKSLVVVVVILVIARWFHPALFTSYIVEIVIALTALAGFMTIIKYHD